MKSLSNITPNEFRRILQNLGLSKKRTKGGHEAWIKEGMTRPIIFQTHISPIPEFIIRNNIRNLDMTIKQFLELLESI